MEMGEVFSKADLSDLPKTKAKVKKRELTRAKSKPNAKRQKDSTQKSLNLRSKQQQVSQENRMVAVPVVGLSRSKPISTVNSRGTLNGAKAKVSETVTSRKVLGSLQTNRSSGSQFQYDLQRVLGKEESVSSSPSQAKTPSDGLPGSTAPQTEVVPSPPPALPPSSVPLEEISKRLVQGLQLEVIFPNSNYLNNVKAELRKAMKQSNPQGYEKLMGYFSTASRPEMATPFINQLQQAVLPGEGAHGADMLPCEPNAYEQGNPDMVALNLEVNTSALNIHDEVSPDHTPRPRDFLDLVDTVTSDWSATPTRPRMFPHKLY